MKKATEEASRGVLNREKATDYFSISKYHPSPELAYFTEHFWIVRWDLRGKEPYRQDVLSHPSVHLVFEKNNTWIWGVVTGKFTTLLKDKGHVLGIKFRPGAFYPFFQKPVASITDQQLPFYDVFHDDLDILETNILKQKTDEKMAEQAELFLKKHLPEPDPNVEEAAKITQTIMDDSSILKVDHLTERFERSKRSLQRLFRTYVGVSPKWVIQRYRLHEAAEQMASGKTDNWPQLALDLGYFDQAHFIRDFKSVVGQSPAEYARSLK